MAIEEDYKNLQKSYAQLVTSRDERVEQLTEERDKYKRLYESEKKDSMRYFKKYKALEKEKLEKEAFEAYDGPTIEELMKDYPNKTEVNFDLVKDIEVIGEKYLKDIKFRFDDIRPGIYKNKSFLCSFGNWKNVFNNHRLDKEKALMFEKAKVKLTFINDQTLTIGCESDENAKEIALAAKHTKGKAFI